MKKLHNLTLIAGSFLLICLSVSCKKQPDKILNYEGISFSYASYWKAETEQLDETHFFIQCQERFDKETIFLVSFYSEEVAPEVLLDSYFNNLEDFELAKEDRAYGKFGRYECVGHKYQLSKRLSKFYGETYAFNAEGKSVLVIKQSEKDYDLKHDKYKTIEDTFSIMEVEMPVQAEGAVASL